MFKTALHSFVLLLLVVNPLMIFAEEGLFQPDAIPAEIKNRYRLTDEHIKKIQAATLKFNNEGTGVFVSPDGLILTNQHVAKDFVQKISNAKTPYLSEGFLAKTTDAELKLPEAEISILMFQKDVTEQINEGLNEKMPVMEIINRQAGKSREIAGKTSKETGLDCEVLSLYEGQKHILYAYKKYKDVRLVFLPESRIAVFGGDKDNFEYPRYWLDIAFLRVYENDQPLKNKTFLPFSKSGVKVNDKLITAGFPLSTERNLTASQLEYIQKTEMPLAVAKIKSDLKTLETYARLSRENTIEVQSQKFEMENSLKALESRLNEMIKGDLLNRRKTEEQKTMANLTSEEKAYFDEVAAAYKKLSQIEAERRFLDLGWGFDTGYIYPARMHLRWALEKAKPQGERSPGYNDQRLAQFENIIRTTVAERSPHELEKLTNSLAMMRQILGPENPTAKKLFGDKNASEVAAQLLTSKLNDQEFRIKLLEQGKEGIENSTDPMIVLLRWIDIRALELRNRFQNEFFIVKARNYPNVAKIMMRNAPANDYPDANSSLRLSFGSVAGYKDGGREIQPFTYVKDLLKKAKSNNYAEPYNLPAVWKDNKKLENSKTPFNFALTNDVAGGNSGSPVINSEGDLVGVIFDSNMPALIWSYEFNDSQGRSIAVDTRAITESLKLYQADNLLKETLGSK